MKPERRERKWPEPLGYWGPEDVPSGPKGVKYEPTTTPLAYTVRPRRRPKGRPKIDRL